MDLIQSLQRALGRQHLPLVVEDLGIITEDVVQLKYALGAPGMVVLQVRPGGGGPGVGRGGVVGPRPGGVSPGRWLLPMLLPCVFSAVLFVVHSVLPELRYTTVLYCAALC